MLNRIAKFVTPGMVEKAVGLPGGSIDSFGFLVMVEMAKGIQVTAIAKGLEADVAAIDALADSITGGPGGIGHDLWKACVVTIRSINLANHQSIGAGWDALEAMAVNRLAQFVDDAGPNLSPKDAVAIASMANKAVRRQAGEGGGAGRSGVSIHAQMGQGAEMAFEVEGGNLGSIRMSLTPRVRAQLEQPRTIEGKANDADDRRMMTIDEVRNVAGK